MRFSWPSLALCAVLLSPAGAFAQDVPAALASVKGRVSVRGQPARAGAPLTGGDEIFVQDGEAVVTLGSGTKLRLSAGSRLKVEEHSAAATALTLRGGRLDAWVRGLAGRRLRVRAGTAVAAVRGTVFAAGAEGGKASFRLYEGTLSIKDDFGGRLVLFGGQRVDIGEGGLGSMGSLPPGERAPAEPEAAPAGAAQGPVSRPGEPAPDSLPAEPGISPSPVQERALGGCTATVSPSAPCP